jgi:hypothetical protein
MTVTPKLQASPSSLVLVGWVGHLRAHHTSGEGKPMEAETAKAQTLPPSRCAARPVTPSRRATSYPVIFAEDGRTETLHIAAWDRADELKVGPSVAAGASRSYARSRAAGLSRADRCRTGGSSFSGPDCSGLRRTGPHQRQRPRRNAGRKHDPAATCRVGPAGNLVAEEAVGCCAPSQNRWNNTMKRKT